MRITSLAAALVSASLVCASTPSFAQQPAAKPDDEQQIQLGTQEVLLDLVATDNKGRPVNDLKADEIKVFEDGSRQEVTSFGLVQADGSDAVAGSKPPPSIEISPFRGFNFIIVVVDRTSLRQQDLKATNDAGQKFVAERLGPNDVMAVFVAANRLVMLQNFTNNKSKLSKALNAATDTSGSAQPLDRGDRLATQVDIASPTTSAGLGGLAAASGSGQEGPPQPVTSATVDNLSASNPNSLANTIDLIANVSNDIDATYNDLVLQFESVALVRELLALMKNYSRIPGRKSLLLYSEGLVVDNVVASALDSLVGTANRNNFAIYTVDAAGLRQETQTRLEAPTGGALNGGPTTLIGNRNDPTLVDASGSSGLGRAERNVRTGGNSALNRLAVETGGVALRNSNDLNRGFQVVEADLRSYYALSYAPTNPALDGKFRSIKVEVSRKGVDVRTRKGYYATPGSSVLLPFEQPVLEMLAASKPESRPSDLPVLMRAERFRAEHGWSIPIVASLPASALAVATPRKGAKDDDPVELEVDMVAIVRDSKGGIIAKTSRSFLYQSPKDRLDEFKKLELANSFSQPMVLPPGGYTISLAVYDPNSQKGTVLERRIALPTTPPGAVSMSSLVLSRDVVAVPPAERERAASDPLVFQGTTRILPNATGLFVKSRGDRLVMYFRCYGLPSKEYQVRTEFVKDGQVVSASQPMAIPETNANGETAFAPSLPLDGLEPGSYVVHVILIDPVSSKPVADTTGNFRVEA